MSEDLKAALRQRLDENYENFLEQLQGKNASELIAMAPEITAVQMLHEELPDICDKDDMEFLLRFNDPLEVVRGYWETEITGYSHSDEMGHMLWEIRDRELYSRDQLVRPEKDTGDHPSPATKDNEASDIKSPFFFCVTVCQRRTGTPIGKRCGVVFADSVDKAKSIAWDKYGGENACKLWVEEITKDGFDFTVYKSEI